MATLSAFSSPSPPWPNPNPNPNPNPDSDSSDNEEQPKRTEQGDVVLPSPPNSVPTQNVNPNLRDARLSPSSVPTLLHISFNQDHGCFAMGTDRGFRVYACDPFREMFRRDFDRGGGIGVVEMRSVSNYMALVGGGSDPQYPLNKVMIWDDYEGRCTGELSFRSDVRAVQFQLNRVVVVSEHKIFVYNFEDLRPLHQMETIANPKGLCAVSQVADSIVLVCPGLQKGQVRVEHYASRRTKFIMAHESRIASIALTMDGQLLATASSKGTLVRIFNTMDGVLLQEVRRGADRAEIYSMAFSSTAQWLAVSSDKGTVHVFSLKVNLASPGNDNSDGASNSNRVVALSSSSLSFMKGVLPKYFSSEWSVAQFRLPEGSQCIVAFGHQQNTVVIIGMDGSFYRCQFDPANGGEMIQLEYHNFLKPENAM